MTPGRAEGISAAKVKEVNITSHKGILNGHFNVGAWAGCSDCWTRVTGPRFFATCDGDGCFAVGGRSDVALGNVVGSNIFNVLFILGLSAMIVPLRVSQQLIRIDVPLMIAVSVLVLVMALDGGIGRLDGLFLGWRSDCIHCHGDGDEPQRAGRDQS